MVNHIIVDTSVGIKTEDKMTNWIILLIWKLPIVSQIMAPKSNGKNNITEFATK